MDPETLNELADQIEGMPAHVARFMAQDRIVHQIHYRLGEAQGRSFRAAAKVFVEDYLPSAASSPELAGLERLLKYAGFGGEWSAPWLKVEVLQMWDQDAWLPLPTSFDIRREWFNLEEATSLSRLALLGPKLPTTCRKMQPYLKKHGDGGMFMRPKSMPNSPHFWVALAAKGGHHHAGHPAPEKYDPEALLRLLPPYAFDKRRLVHRSKAPVSPE
jgi:hypothetical protein